MFEHIERWEHWVCQNPAVNQWLFSLFLVVYNSRYDDLWLMGGILPPSSTVHSSTVLLAGTAGIATREDKSTKAVLLRPPLLRGPILKRCQCVSIEDFEDFKLNTIFIEHIGNILEIDIVLF